MRNYLEDWLSEEESVVVPPPAQSVSRQRRTKQAARGALYAAMGKVGRVERLILGEERGQAVPLAFSGWSQRAETVEHLDRAVQRDARRYDGGFSLY